MTSGDPMNDPNEGVEPFDATQQYCERLPTFDEAWEGVMITYKEQDFPTSEPYERTIPGWKCLKCGHRIGTSKGPPRRCYHCEQEWDGLDPFTGKPVSHD